MRRSVDSVHGCRRERESEVGAHLSASTSPPALLFFFSSSFLLLSFFLPGEATATGDNRRRRRLHHGEKERRKLAKWMGRVARRRGRGSGVFIGDAGREREGEKDGAAVAWRATRRDAGEAQGRSYFRRDAIKRVTTPAGGRRWTGRDAGG